jgi:c-di-GMP-binding flagellar brake protein YcgR
MSRGKDLREHPRLGPLIIKVEFESKRFSGEGYLTNLSLGGAFLAVEEIPSAGDRLSLRITLPWKLGQITAEAKVVRQVDSGHHTTTGQPSGAGLQFTELSSSAEESIRLYIQRFSELAAQLNETA